MSIPLVVGGGLALASGISNYLDDRDRTARAEDAYNRIMGLSSDAAAANQGDIDAFANLVQNAYGSGAANYQQALQDFLNSEVFQNQGFSFDGTINDYFDPAANQRVAAAMQAIENSAATGGNRFSSDYVNRVAAKQQALASEEWQNAYNRLMQAENQKMAEWNANSQNAWNNYNATQQRAQYAVDAYGNDRNAYMQGMGDVLGAGMQNRNANLQTQAEAISGMANAQNQQGGFLSSVLGPASTFFNSYYAGKGA